MGDYIFKCFYLFVYKKVTITFDPKTQCLNTIALIATIDKMETSTIQLSKETKRKISSFGVKGESYDDIIKRVYSLAVKEQLREFLMFSEGFISIDEARKRLDKKWPR